MTTQKDWQEYSLQYLGCWFAEDKWSTEALSSGSDEKKRQSLIAAANYYRISRNLPRKSEGPQKRLQPALAALDKINNLNSLDASVERLCSELSEVYWQKSRICISAATKFLWIKFNSPVIIYDSQAYSALWKLSGPLPEVRNAESYRVYREAWRKQYEQNEDDIRKACETLSNYETSLAGAEKLPSSLLLKPDFMERVFDMYLWDIGGQPEAGAGL